MALSGVLAVAATACASAAIDPQVIEDAQTVARVRSALVNDPQLGVRPIEVRVTAGTAHLTGRVGSEDEARRLVDLVRGVAGVVDVRSDVQVVAPSTLDAPVIDVDEPIAPASERRLLAVGVTLSRFEPRDDTLAPRTSIGPLVRLGSGSGLGATIAFNWTSADLFADGNNDQSLGQVRLRPVMGGVGYTWSGGQTSATVSLVAGYSFNSLRIDDPTPGQPVAVRVADSLAWRPGFSFWYDMSGRLAMNVFAGHLFARPTLTVLDSESVSRRTLRADTSVVRVGLAYKLF